MCTCVCVLSHTYVWHTNMYAVTLRRIIYCLPLGSVLGSITSSQSIPPAHNALHTLCLVLCKALQVSAICHPEGKVHISQTGAKGLGRTGV